MRGAQAAVSPNFGAPAAPVPWQATHCAANTWSPVFIVDRSLASLISTWPTGAMRLATACSFIASLPAEGLSSEATKVTSSTIAMIGTMKANTTAITNCFGVLIGPS